MPPSPITPPPPLQHGFGCLTGVIAIAAGILGAGLAVSGDPRALITALVTALFLADLAFAERSGRLLDRPATALAALPLLIPIASLAARDMHVPFAWIEAEMFGRGDEIFFALTLLAVLPSIALIGVALGRFAARALVRADRPRRSTFVRPLAWAACAGAAGLLALTAARAGRPPVERYLSSLPIIARMPPLGEQAPSRREIAAGVLHVRRERVGVECGISLARERPAPAPTQKLSPHGFGAAFLPCGAIVVRADEAHQLWFIEAIEEPRGQLAAYDMRGASTPIEISPLHVSSALRAPDAFVALAALGLVVGLIALVRRRTPELPPEGEAMCVDAVVRDGVVYGPEGQWPLPADTSFPDGLAVAALAVKRGSFREHAGEAMIRVIPGTLAEHALAARLGGEAFALSFVTLAATPLAVAAAHLG